jgi:hypothetical protein
MSLRAFFTLWLSVPQYLRYEHSIRLNCLRRRKTVIQGGRGPEIVYDDSHWIAYSALIEVMSLCSSWIYLHISASLVCIFSDFGLGKLLLVSTSTVILASGPCGFYCRFFLSHRSWLLSVIEFILSAVNIFINIRLQNSERSDRLAEGYRGWHSNQINTLLSLLKNKLSLYLLRHILV